MKASTERTAIVRLDGIEYDVAYSISGDCTYEEAKTSGPPERCYEGWSDSQVTSTTISAVFVEGTQVQTSERLRADLLKELAKLPLDDYLFEAFMSQEPDPYEPGD